MTAKPLIVLLAVGLVGCASSGGGGSVSGTASEPRPEPTVAPPPAQAATRDVAADAMPAMSFSAEQADRGRTVFRSKCTECHNSSEFRDRQFRFKWRRRSAGDLFELVSTSMPEDFPGALEGRQYADVVAYMLRLNGFEPGEGELPADIDALDALSLAPLGNRGRSR